MKRTCKKLMIKKNYVQSRELQLRKFQKNNDNEYEN